MNAPPIIAGVDGSEESLRAAEWAAREATTRNTALRIVSAPALPPRMSPDPAGRETVAGIIHQATRDALARAGGSTLGSVAYATLNHAHGPVATVPSS